MVYRYALAWGDAVLVMRAWHGVVVRLAAAGVIVGFLTTGCDSAAESPSAGPHTPSSSPFVQPGYRISPGPSGAVASGPNGPGSLPAPSEPAGADDHAPAGPPPPGEQADGLAGAFAGAWTQSTLSADRWWAQIAPLCAPRFAGQLRTTDPGNIPARRVTGPPVLTSGDNPVRTYTVPTDAGALTVIVGAAGGQWRVVGNDFRRA